MQKLGLVCLCVCALLAPQTLADPVISNFSAGVGTGTIFGPNATTIYKTFGWTMLAGDDYYLDDVTLTMEFTATPATSVSIWDGAAAPQNKLATLQNPNLVGSGDFKFTPASPFVMSAGGSYWVYVEALAGSDDFWWQGTNPSTMPSGIATAIGYIFNGSPSSYYNRLDVNGTIVPEPASLVLLALAGLVVRRR